MGRRPTEAVLNPIDTATKGVEREIRTSRRTFNAGTGKTLRRDSKWPQYTVKFESDSLIITSLKLLGEVE